MYLTALIFGAYEKRNCCIDSPKKYSPYNCRFSYLSLLSIYKHLLFGTKNRHLCKNDDSSNLFRLLPTHSCIINIVYSFDIAYERGMVVVVLLQVSVFNIQILRPD